MAYYPKNKIQQNLQTNGGEYKTIPNYNSGIDSFYSGYYYKLYNGKTYTGKYPGDGNNEEIISILTATSPPNTTSLTTTDIPPLFPTPKDYEVGVFTRYFSKKRNEYLFNELTKGQKDFSFCPFVLNKIIDDFFSVTSTDHALFVSVHFCARRTNYAFFS